MFLDKNAIIIDGVNFGQYILTVKYGYHKLWGNDAGRNLNGSQSGTLVGIFPKFIIQFRKLTKAELEIVAPILDKPSQSFTYYDPNKKQNLTIQTYTGDYDFINKYVIGNDRKNEGFACSFIAINKR